MSGEGTQLTLSLTCLHSGDIHLPDSWAQRAWGQVPWSGQILGTLEGSGHAAPLPRYQVRYPVMAPMSGSVVTELETVGINNGIIWSYQVPSAHSLSHIRPGHRIVPDSGQWDQFEDILWEIRMSITYFLTLFPRILITNLPLTFLLQLPWGHTCVINIFLWL